MLLGCKDQQIVKAKIFERKEIEKDRLLVKYVYLLNNQLYHDSAIIKNVVIGNDSIRVIIDPSNPAKGIPDLTELHR